MCQDFVFITEKRKQIKTFGNATEWRNMLKYGNWHHFEFELSKEFSKMYGKPLISLWNDKVSAMVITMENYVHKYAKCANHIATLGLEKSMSIWQNVQEKQ